VAGLVGILLALSVSIAASVIGLDKNRACYPTVLAVVASCLRPALALGVRRR